MAAATILCINSDHAEATAVLAGALKSADAKLRTRAIEVCSEMTPKTKALVPLLIESLKEDAESTRLRQHRRWGRWARWLSRPFRPWLLC